jgi:hypothetical protein
MLLASKKLGNEFAPLDCSVALGASCGRMELNATPLVSEGSAADFGRFISADVFLRVSTRQEKRPNCLHANNFRYEFADNHRLII